jgi:uncharacterized protein
MYNFFMKESSKEKMKKSALNNIGPLLLAIIGIIIYSNYVKDDFGSKTYDEMYLDNSFDRPVVVLKAKDLNSDSNRIYIEVEIADSAYERGVGLMFRENLESYAGMLFIFDEDNNAAFWMKNTLIALDIVYISEDKKIVSIIDSAQPCEIDVCPMYEPDDIYRYTLEVNAGYIKDFGIEVGDTVEFFGLEFDDSKKD